jgi:hypothetical protein
MPTPNKDNVEKLMEEFKKALSERDVEFLVGMAQEDEEPKSEEDEKG